MQLQRRGKRDVFGHMKTEKEDKKMNESCRVSMQEPLEEWGSDIADARRYTYHQHCFKRRVLLREEICKAELSNASGYQ